MTMKTIKMTKIIFCQARPSSCNNFKELAKLLNDLQYYHKIKSYENFMTVEPSIDPKIGHVIYNCFKIHDNKLHDKDLEKQINFVESEQVCQCLWDHS